MLAARPLSLAELVIEPLEAPEALSSPKATSERPSLSLLLLVARHASLIVDPSLRIVPEGLIGLVDRREFLLGLGGFVDVGVVLLGQLEVGFLDLVLGRAPAHAKRRVEVLLVVQDL